MLRKFIVFITSALLIFPSGPALGATPDTVVHLMDSTGAGISGVELWIDAAGTSLRIKTDSTGTANLSSVRGFGTFRINHCAQAATSISLYAPSVDFGDGGKTINIKLPQRPKVYEFQISDTEGTLVRAYESVGGRSSASAYVSIGDSGPFTSDIGGTELSSCGLAWYSSDTLRVAPFITAREEPKISILEEIPGGTTVSSYPVNSLSTTEKSRITIGHFRYVYVEPSQFVVYQRQSVRIKGTVRGVKNLSEIPTNAGFGVQCKNLVENMPGAGMNATAIDENLKITATMAMNRPGDYRCVLAAGGRYDTSSFAFAIQVLPLKAYTSATRKKYKTCALLNTAFQGGLAKSAKEQQADASSTFISALSPSGYALNKALDVDKDGIACER